MTTQHSNQICLISKNHAFLSIRNKAKPTRIAKIPSSKQQHQTWQTQQTKTILKDYWAVHRITGRAGKPHWSFPERDSASSHHRTSPVKKQPAEPAWTIEAGVDITATDVLGTQDLCCHRCSQRVVPTSLLVGTLLPISSPLIYTLSHLKYFACITTFIFHKRSMMIHSHYPQFPDKVLRFRQVK